tara:strand:- start:766 stop:882 length:117 start_codon:yes stop_codon:yes gene_type:complete
MGVQEQLKREKSGNLLKQQMIGKKIILLKLKKGFLDGN